MPNEQSGVITHRDNNIKMEKVHERELVLVRLGEILADRTLRVDERHTFEYFQAYFLKLPNRKEYLNRLYQTEKQRIEGLSYKEICSLFQAMYEAVKQRRKVVFPRKKAYYRKVRFRATWTPCNIQCDQNYLSIFKDQNDIQQCKQLDIGHVTVAKGVIKNGEYYEFQIIYHKREYQISFQLEYYCSSLYQKLVNLIQLKKMEKLTIMDYQSKRAFYFQHARKKGLKQLVVDKKEGTEKEMLRIKTAKYTNRWPLSQVLQEKISQFKEYNQIEYNLVKNIANGNVSRNKKTNHLKLNLIIPKVSIDVAIETYLRFQDWNSQIQTFSIGKQLEQNSYQAFLKMKQYNRLTYQRQTHLRITFIQEITSDNYLSASFNESDDFYRHKNKYYLFIASIPHQTDNTNTKFTIHQLIEFSQLSDNNIFMTIIHELDFNSYRIIASNFDVSMTFFKDIEFINNLCTQNMFQRKKKGLSQSRGSKIIESSSKISGSKSSIEQLQLPKMQKVNTLTTTTEAHMQLDSSLDNPEMQHVQP